MKKLFTLIAVFAALCATSTLAQKSPKQDPWKQAGTDDSLRKAFDKALYSLKESGHATGTETWTGTNDAQRLSMQFDAHEARLTHPDGSVSFHLNGYGYGNEFNTPATPKLSSDGTRLEYRRGDFTEWYVNGRQGLEQGFTLAHKPSGVSNGQPLTIALGVTGSLALSQQDGAVLLKSGKSTVLRYGGLSARDALGRAIPAHMEARNNEIRLVVEDQHAQYPLTVDPTWTQQQELTDPESYDDDEFGYSVAISGPIAVIGAYQAPVGNNNPGAAYVFVQNGDAWTMQQELTASDGGTNGAFGYSVAVSGTTALIGAPYHTVGGKAQQGAAYVFVQSGTTWSQQQELAASDGAVEDEFGTSVALSGTTAVIGAPIRTVGGNVAQGAAYIFVQSGTTWSQQAELTASDGAEGDDLGFSVALSGTTVILGALEHKVGSNALQGAAYVFVQSGTAWSQQAELTASDGQAGDYFGHAVAISGTTAMVGAPNRPARANIGPGAAYVFEQSGSTWTQQQELTSSSGLGSAIAISGTTALIGEAFAGGEAPGAAYVFVKSNGAWSQQQKLTHSVGATFPEFGFSVAMSGTTALVGTSQEYGTAYVFSTGALPSPATLTTPSPGSTLTSTRVEFDWPAAEGVPYYDLHLSATAFGNTDLYNSGHVAGTSVTVTVPGNGATIYARLYSWINGGWQYTDSTYTAEMQAPVLIGPTPGTALTSASATFNWTAASSHNQGYWLFLGTQGVGSQDLYDSHQQAATSATFSGLPTNGKTIYARIYTCYKGVLVYNDYTYTAWRQPATLTSPTPNSTLPGVSVTFTWTAEPSAKGYWLFLGTTGAGSKNLFDSNEQTATSATFNSLPNNGATIYARVYTSYNGVLVYNDYRFTAHY
jgi:FG-GAP repeat